VAGDLLIVIEVAGVRRKVQWHPPPQPPNVPRSKPGGRASTTRALGRDAVDRGGGWCSVQRARR